MVVEEREQIRFAATDPRAVQRIPGPAVVGVFGFEPPEHRRGVPGGRADQLQAMKEPQQRRFRRRPPRAGPQNALHLRGGPRRVLPLERGRQLQRRGIGTRRARPRRGNQLGEPAGPVAADPPIQGVARIPHRSPERIDVLTGGDLADQPATGLRRQPGIQCRADQLIPEQPDRVASFTPFLILSGQRNLPYRNDATQTRCRAVIPATMNHRQR